MSDTRLTGYLIFEMDKERVKNKGIFRKEERIKEILIKYSHTKD